MAAADRLTLEERFWSKVDVRGSTECWLWTAATTAGYGVFSVAAGTPHRAHLVALELSGASIEDGYVADHICHTRDATCPGGSACYHRRCCNPAHLEQVTRKENVMRGRGHGPTNKAKTHCPQGHEYTEEDTRVRSHGWRECRTCRRRS